MIVNQRQRRAILLAYASLVLVTTLAPVPRVPEAVPDYFDKVVHATLFGGMALLMYWNLRATTRLWHPVAFLVAASFAGLIEVLQDWVPYRTGDVWDFLAGSVGALGVVVVLGFYRRRNGGSWEHDESRQTIP